MRLRTVRLDEETEKALQKLARASGLPVSSLLRRGVLVLRDSMAQSSCGSPYEIYRKLDLGPGGYSIAPAATSRQAVRKAIARKLGR